MITDLQLSQRLFQFFDTMFGAEKVNFGFNADSNFAFNEDRQNNDLRTKDKTLLFYRMETDDKIGNQISSDTQVYNRDTGKEEIITMRQISVVMNIMTKEKGMAKDAMQAFLAYMQSTRRNNASYDLPFPLVLVNSEIMQNLSALEEGAWVERLEKRLYFRYNDKITIGDIQFTQEPATLEETKEIIQYDITLKNPL
jgi:hypothetical protein